MTYDVRNPGLGLGQTQTYSRVKIVNGILILHAFSSKYYVFSSSFLYVIFMREKKQLLPHHTRI